MQNYSFAACASPFAAKSFFSATARCVNGEGEIMPP